MGVTEATLQQQVADYLRLQYPDVLFHSDFGSGIKLTMGQAVKQKRQNGGRRAWPDMFIAEPRPAKGYCGLFLELKREGTRLYKKDGTWATPHIAEQAETISKLNESDYLAGFVCGFEEAKRVIDSYLKGTGVIVIAK